MYTRYKTVMDLVETITKDNANDVVSDICEYFHQNFADPTVMHSGVGSDTFKRLCGDVRQLLIFPSDAVYAEKVKAIPPAFAALVWPIAVMRYILRDLKVDINPKKCTGFRLFFEMYGRLIISS